MSRRKRLPPGLNCQTRTPEAIALAHNHIIHLSHVEDSDAGVAGDRGACFR